MRARFTPSSRPSRSGWLAAGVVLGGALMALVRPAAATRERPSDPCPNPRAFRELYRNVRNLALAQPDEQTLYRGAADGMLATLDPYTRLISADEWQQMSRSVRGEAVGVGVDLEDDQGRLVTGMPQAGSPAARAGLHAGEVVLAINGRPTRCLSAGKAALLLFGSPGTTVTLEVADGQARPATVALVRVEGPRRLVQTRLYGNAIGYLRVAVFADGVAAEAKAQLAKVRAKAGASFQGLIIDLRHDPGGLLEEAVALADLFVAHGTLVTVMERDGRRTQTLKASGAATQTGYPLVVLVDERTASAAEAFTAALREQHRALVVGTRTLGKSTVQDYVPLEDGSVLEITKARYLTPSGRSLDGVGLAPDLRVPPRPGKGDLDLRMAAYALRHWQKLRPQLAELPRPASP